ncbi:MAG: hypothetical protein ACMUIG_05750 [Thermoplasmatota archaeon]
MVLIGNAFCPGHIDGFFSIHDQTDHMMRTGIRGAGMNLSLGVMVMNTLKTPEDTGSRDPLKVDIDASGVEEFLVDEDIYRMVLEYLLPGKGSGWESNLRVRIQLPVSQGFSMSSAGILATSISVWEALYSKMPSWDRKLRFRAQQERFFSMKKNEMKLRPIKKRYSSKPRITDSKKASGHDIAVPVRASGMMNWGGIVKTPSDMLKNSRASDDVGLISYADCIYAAHRIDIMTGGGIGDIVALARGGITMRLSPGVPPFGEIHTIPSGVDKPPRIVLVILGDPLDRITMLTNPLRRNTINKIGAGCLKDLLLAPSINRFVSESRKFADGSGFMNYKIKRALSEIDDISPGSMVMLGNSAFSLVTTAEDSEEIIRERWMDHGTVFSMDLDLHGARPLN